MSIITILIPLSLLLTILAIGIFFWAIRNKQFDDLESPAHRIIFDDKYTNRTKKLKKDE